MEQAVEKWNQNLSKVPWLERPTNGDASETALIKFFQPIEDIEATRAKYTLVKDSEGKNCKMPFNSTNKYAFLIVENETENSYYTLFTKGAPERIWNLCDSVYNKGRVEEKDLDWEKSFEAVNASFGKNGERVLGFA